MRVFPTAIRGGLSRRLGSEPVIVAEIEFVKGSPLAFSTAKLNGLDEPKPQIVSTGSLDSTTLATLSSDSQSTSIVLSDLDGTLKTLIDTNDISLGKVTFSLCFQGVPFSERAQLLQGVIFSPVVYSTINKTLSFSVVSTVSDSDVGFSMDDGDFPDIPEDQRGLAWPMIFGTVCAVKTLPLKPIFKGTLNEPLGAIDPTIPLRLCQAYKLQCPPVYDPQFADKIRELELARDQAYEDLEKAMKDAGQPMSGTQVGGRGITVNMRFWSAAQLALACMTAENRGFPHGIVLVDIPGCLTPTFKKLAIAKEHEENITNALREATSRQNVCLEARQSQICKILTEREQQSPYVKSSVQILGGDKFPQGAVINIRIGSVKYIGIMTGTSFAILGVTHPSSLDVENPPCMDVDTGYATEGIPSFDFPPTLVADCDSKPELGEVLYGPGASWRYFFDFKAGAFIWLPSGTDVFLEESSTLTHIVSLIQGSVTQVAAYRTFGDAKILTEVDPSEYTVFIRDFGDYIITELQLNRRLSEIPDEKWDDELYVNFQSVVGPNPVNVIKYLIEKFTTYTWDPTSFAAVTTALAKYPVNFVLRERTSVTTLIREIVFQSRCAVTIRGDVVYLTYLPAEPASLRTLTAANILRDTFDTTTTRTEDLATKHIISWQQTEAKAYPDLNTEEVLSLRHNVGRYGSSETSYNYFSQNTFSTIEKSATFWLIRQSNSWVYAEFETTLANLDLDVYDCITVSYPGFVTTKCIIEEMNVDFDRFTIRFKCWTPFLAGTSVGYKWAWPANLAAGSLFPDPDYKDRGDGLGKTVRPPVGHPLRQGYNLNTPTRLSTDGDKNPSDLDDVFPTARCARATPAEFSADIAPTLPPFEAQAWSNFADALDGKGGVVRSDRSGGPAGGGGGPRKKRKRNGCGFSVDYTGCEWVVHVTYVQPFLVGTSNCGGPCTSTGNPVGIACNGILEQACFTFGDEASAQSFATSQEAERAAKFCTSRLGEWTVYGVAGPTAISTRNCVDPNAPSFVKTPFVPKRTSFASNPSLQAHLDS